MRRRWAALPRRGRWVLAVYVAGFLEGACSHFADLAGAGLHAYASFGPPPLQGFFVALAVLDPLVVLLVALVRPAGVRLAAVVMALDVAGNWWANRHWVRDSPVRLLPLLPITLFGLFVVATSVLAFRLAKGPGPAHR